MATANTKIPQWLLERLLIGELDAATEADVKKRLAQEPGGLERLNALRQENEAILKAHPPATVAREVRRRHAQAQGDKALSRGRAPWKLWLPGLAAAALAVAVLMPMGGGPSSAPIPPETDITRVKGIRPQLTVHRKTGRDVERLGDEAKVNNGDVLQLSYNAAGEPFGLIFSLDGSGVVTLHHPTDSGRTPTLTTTGRVFLPRSYALDDAPDFERFFLITSKAPFDADGVIEAARKLARDKARAARDALELPSDLNQTSVTLRKVEQP